MCDSIWNRLSRSVPGSRRSSVGAVFGAVSAGIETVPVVGFAASALSRRVVAKMSPGGSVGSSEAGCGGGCGVDLGGGAEGEGRATGGDGGDCSAGRGAELRAGGTGWVA